MSTSNNVKTALITGITGQDGSFLAEQLLAKGYCVHGLVRRSSSTSRNRLDRLFHDPSIYNQSLFLHYADLDDVTTIRRILVRTEPDELYHLAGQSHVGASFEIPETTCQFTAMGTLKLLEILRDLSAPPKLCHISSSEVFGRPDSYPQNEATPMRPVTPYGIAKTFATQMVTLYRESFGLFACNAICYNHESERRGESFVTRKISKAAAEIAAGSTLPLRMGDTTAKRDWGYAPEYVDAMWRTLQAPVPGDYVLATGVQSSVQDFLDAAFESVGLDYREHVVHDPKYDRPSEVRQLVGDASKAKSELRWSAETTVGEIARLMVRADAALIQLNSPSTSEVS